MDKSTKQLLNLRLRYLFRRWEGKIVTGEEKGVGYESVS